jgi:hypothetical protein
MKLIACGKAGGQQGHAPAVTTKNFKTKQDLSSESSGKYLNTKTCLKLYYLRVSQQKKARFA